MYKNAIGVTTHNGNITVILRFLSGVLQGCPGSAMLFDLSLDPLLHMFEKALDYGKKGIVRACADDLAFALARVSHLSLLFPIYEVAKHCAGLSLKFKKCCIVPCTDFNSSSIAKVRKWLRQHIESWQEFRIEGATELLGFFVGPLANQYMWVKPMRKYRKRMADIKRAGAGLALNVHDYNTRISPVLGYVSQLVPLPKTFQYDQRIALHTLYRAPMNTFAHADFFLHAKTWHANAQVQYCWCRSCAHANCGKNNYMLETVDTAT